MLQNIKITYLFEFRQDSPFHNIYTECTLGFLGGLKNFPVFARQLVA